MIATTAKAAKTVILWREYCQQWGEYIYVLKNIGASSCQISVDGTVMLINQRLEVPRQMTWLAPWTC